MNALDTFRDLTLPQSIQITDEHQNTYDGTLEWDAETETYILDDLRLTPEYADDTLYIVRPLPEDSLLNGFIAEVTEIICLD